MNTNFNGRVFASIRVNLWFLTAPPRVLVLPTWFPDASHCAYGSSSGLSVLFLWFDGVFEWPFVTWLRGPLIVEFAMGLHPLTVRKLLRLEYDFFVNL